MLDSWRPPTGARLNAFNDQYHEEQDGVRKQVWDYFAELKVYRAAPDPTKKEDLSARFDTILTTTTNFVRINQVLRGIH